MTELNQRKATKEETTKLSFIELYDIENDWETRFLKNKEIKEIKISTVGLWKGKNLKRDG